MGEAAAGAEHRGWGRDLQRRARESHCGMSPPRRPTDLRSLKSSEPHGSLLNGSLH